MVTSFPGDFSIFTFDLLYENWSDLIKILRIKRCIIWRIGLPPIRPQALSEPTMVNDDAHIM